MINGVDDTVLANWIEQSLRTNTHTLAIGYQGKTLLYHEGDISIVIKVPHGKSLIKYFHTRLVRHEHKAYQRLGDMPGVPKCYGLVDNQYLALEYISGHPIRQKRPLDEPLFFKRLFEYVGDLHNHGVTHMDLKKKDNLLVVDGDQPVMIDFGVSLIKKEGFHPFNHFWFKIGILFDYNAWLKQKYNGKFDAISEEDSKYYNRTMIEKAAKVIKHRYLRIKRVLGL